VSVTRGFGSDNQSGAHPRILEALVRANAGHVRGYGNDPYTAALNREVGPLFGPDATILPAFGGTGANVTAIAAMCDRWQAVLCASSAHLTVDEAGAIEAMTGIKPVPVTAPDGKVTPEAVDATLATLTGVHQADPGVLSLTQATEVGTTYGLDELGKLVDHAHERGLLVHLDGARLANAAAFLGCSLAALTGEVGIDVLTLGGAKNGMLFGEAIVVLNPAAAPKLQRAQKTLGQLLSKQRYVSAQLLELFGTSLWRELAEQANAAAQAVGGELGAVPGVRVLYPVQANSVFVQVEPSVAGLLTTAFFCQPTAVPAPALRIMASWDTEAADVDRLVDAVRARV
jgi:threonine aldolase